MDRAGTKRGDIGSKIVFEGNFEAICAKLSHFPRHEPIAIVGSTALTNARARFVVRCVILATQPSLIVSGGAPGIDSLAAEIGRAYGLPIDERKPDVNRWRGTFRKSDGVWLRGFNDRNQEIADRCKGLVRIAWIGSTTYGSGWTRDRAEEQGKPTEEFWLRSGE